MNLLKDKKGQGANYLSIIIVLVFYGFFAILAFTVWKEIVSALTIGGYNTGQVAATILDWNQAFGAADYLIVLLFILLLLGLGITSHRLPTSTAFFIITIITGIFWGLVSYFFNFIFIQLVSPAVMQATLGAFPRTMLLCTNLHWIMLINIVIGSFTLYGKEEKGQFLT